MYQISVNAKNTVKNVVQEVFTAVTCTLGPDGRLAIISDGTSAKATKDGVTVAKAMKFADDASEYVNRVLTEPALKTADECGDGTTTTIFLTKHLFDIFNTYPSFFQHRQIEKLTDFMIESLSKQTIEINTQDNPELLLALANTSSNSDDRIAHSVVKAFTESLRGFPEIELKQGISEDDIISKSNGLPLSMYLSSSSFSSTGTGDVTSFSKIVPLVFDKTLRGENDVRMKQALDILTQLHNAVPEEGTIVFISRGMEHDLINLFNTVNNTIGRKRFVSFQSNAGGSVGTLLLGDIATVFNTGILNDISDVPAVMNSLSYYAEPFTVSMERAVLTELTDDTRERIAKRIEGIESAIKESGQSRHNFRVKFNEKRIRDLRGELITIIVGGSTQSEVKERYDRFEDVVEAVKSGLTNGILPGIGHALRVTSVELLKTFGNDESIQPEVLRSIVKMCHYQYLTLMRTNMSEQDVIDYEEMGEENLELLLERFGYVNLATGKKSNNPADLGVYDTAYASITALKGGVKTAKILATTETILLGNKLSAVSFQRS